MDLSKSSVHRHQQAQQRRAQHPESAFWESAAGADFLERVVYAALYQFGLKNHIGAEQLSEFFRLIRIDTHVGVSPNALRIRLRQMESLLPTFQAECEQSATCPTPQRTVAMDEVFFNDQMLMVLMDLPSGYLLVEEAAEDRRFVTWHEKAAARLQALNLEVKHAISDRAKALIKLAVEGFGCAAGADLFHAQYDLSRWFPAALARATRTAAQAVGKTQKALEKQHTTPSGDSPETCLLSAQAEQAAARHAELEQALPTYRQHQQAISFAVHPFNKDSGEPNTAASVTASLHAEVDGLEGLTTRLAIPDTHGALGKFRRQIDDLGSHVDVWWHWVSHLLADTGADPPLQDWVKYQLLPTVYWHHQHQQTQKKGQREAFQTAWEEASRHLRQVPLPSRFLDDDLNYWLAWCEDKVQHFHRASSAVEGRNGCLAQMYHKGRGLTDKRLKALTVIHNYGVRRADGSTAAKRLFGTTFPDLFEWLLPQMGELALPRKRQGTVKPNSLMLQGVPP